MGIKFTSKAKRDALAQRLGDLVFHMQRSLDQGADHRIQVTIEMIEDITVAAAIVGLADIKPEK